MIRTSLFITGLFAVTLGAAAESVDRATVDALATTYTFGVAEAPTVGCIVELKAERRVVVINDRCRERFPQLGAVSNWQPTGGASIALFGGTPLRELSNFSPAQDGTGVYLRGGFAGDPAVYELRPPQ
jgi:hypothetical protein